MFGALDTAVPARVHKTAHQDISLLMPLLKEEPADFPLL
jgi:hypothetical protein